MCIPIHVNNPIESNEKQTDEIGLSFNIAGHLGTLAWALGMMWSLFYPGGKKN